MSDVRISLSGYSSKRKKNTTKDKAYERQTWLSKIAYLNQAAVDCSTIATFVNFFRPNIWCGRCTYIYNQRYENTSHVCKKIIASSPLSNAIKERRILNSRNSLEWVYRCEVHNKIPCRASPFRKRKPPILWWIGEVDGFIAIPGISEPFLHLYHRYIYLYLYTTTRNDKFYDLFTNQLLTIDHIQHRHPNIFIQKLTYSVLCQ